MSKAADRLLQAVGDSRTVADQSLISSLRAALASIDRSHPISAINQLQTFQSKVLPQVAPQDPEPAASFIQQAQDIIDILAEGELGARKLKALANQDTGKVGIEFSGSAGRIYIIEASTDMVTWQTIGVANEKRDGQCEFEDRDTD